jgi:hypothetical protein
MSARKYAIVSSAPGTTTRPTCRICRSVAELLGHQSMKMTMRYAHLSPAFLTAEVGLLDPPPPTPAAPPAVAAEARPIPKRARKGQRRSQADRTVVEMREFLKENGSSGWARTSNPPVNSVTQVVGLPGSSCR